MEQELKSAFMQMKRQEALDIAEEALKRGEDPLRILNTCREAMVKVGERFETGEFFLSELKNSCSIEEHSLSMIPDTISVM